MKVIRVFAERTVSGNYLVKSVQEKGEGVELNIPSLVLGLLRIRKKLGDDENPESHLGFEYTFPLTFERK